MHTFILDFSLCSFDLWVVGRADELPWSWCPVLCIQFADAEGYFAACTTDTSMSSSLVSAAFLIQPEQEEPRQLCCCPACMGDTALYWVLSERIILTLPFLRETEGLGVSRPGLWGEREGRSYLQKEKSKAQVRPGFLPTFNLMLISSYYYH